MSLRFMVTLSVFLVVGNSADGQDVRLKLCGREFIRMVVTSCGSSRMRRSVLDFNHTHLGTHSLLDSFTSTQSTNQTQVQKAGGPHWPDETARRMEETGKSTEEPRMEPSASQAASVSIRTTRDVGPAGVCCRSGCTMSELVQYC